MIRGAAHQLRERVATPLGGLIGRWRERGPATATIATNLRPMPGPWGGGNQWAAQLVGALEAHGYRVRFRLDEPVDLVLLADPRRSGTTTFDVADLERYLAAHPSTVVVHRVNENDQRKGTATMDGLLAAANRLADHTVFISAWLHAYHAARWFPPPKPYSIIINGADTRIFHPIGRAPYLRDGPLRLVTHHWSDNAMKGFGVYETLDRMIADGELRDTELWVIGRWPAGIRWRAARTFGPVHGRRLAELLRRCHAYVTASVWEPGGMHFIEGAQCGLPVLYHRDGGGIVEVAERFGVAFADDLASAVETLRGRIDALRAAVLTDAPSGDRMCADYLRVIQRAIVAGKVPS